MITKPKDIPACVYLLADHLDATLAAGEDLSRCALSLKVDETNETSLLAERIITQRKALEEIRTLELLIIARVLQARERAKEVADAAPMFRSFAQLFASGTTNLRDIVTECGDSTRADFDTGDGIMSYLRKRGLVHSEVSCITQDASALNSGEIFESRFLVASHLPLGVLLDNIATFLDALDMHFDLYQDLDNEDELEAASDPIADEDGEAASALKFEGSEVLAGLPKRAARDTLADRLSRLH